MAFVFLLKKSNRYVYIYYAFFGEHCEEELSGNLWSFDTPIDEVVPNGVAIQTITVLVFDALILFNIFTHHSHIYLLISSVLFIQNLSMPPFVAMYNWFIVSTAIERMLVECFGNYGLYLL